MNLAKKMFTRETKSCPMRSDCKKESDKRYFGSLFETDWEVFVVKRNSEKGLFDWFTLCCEDARPEIDDKRNNFAATCC